jgi:hypothetical protein
MDLERSSRYRNIERLRPKNFMRSGVREFRMNLVKSSTLHRVFFFKYEILRTSNSVRGLQVSLVVCLADGNVSKKTLRRSVKVRYRRSAGCNAWRLSPACAVMTSKLHNRGCMLGMARLSLRTAVHIPPCQPHHLEATVIA